jgi:hypothetical protein
VSEAKQPKAPDAYKTLILSSSSSLSPTFPLQNCDYQNARTTSSWLAVSLSQHNMYTSDICCTKTPHQRYDAKDQAEDPRTSPSVRVACIRYDFPRQSLSSLNSNTIKVITKRLRCISHGSLCAVSKYHELFFLCATPKRPNDFAKKTTSPATLTLSSTVQVAPKIERPIQDLLEKDFRARERWLHRPPSRDT